MHKSKSHGFVILPSSVRTIPFTVPGLSASSASSLSASSASVTGFPAFRNSSQDIIAVTDGLGCSCRRRRRHHLASSSDPPSAEDLTQLSYQDRYRSLEVPCHFCRTRRTTNPSPLSLATAASSSSSDSSSACPPGLSSVAERWASEPSFLGQTLPSAEIRRSQLGLRATNKVSCDSVNTINSPIEITKANSICGIDPSLYISSEFGSDYGGGDGKGGNWLAAVDDFDTDYDESNIGRVWFGLEYDPESERLLVTLIRIRNLPNALISNNHGRDPFIRICLMPDERRWVQTKFRKKTPNPIFNEKFAFQVSVRDFAERSIKITVFGSGDRHNRHQLAIGNVAYALKDHLYEPNERVLIWRDFEKESVTSQKTTEASQLHVSLSYNGQLNRLSVAVYSGKNFPPSENHDRQSNEFFVVVSLLEMSKTLKKKKTSVVKHCVNFNPIFNEMFHFKVNSSSLDLISLLIRAKRHITGHKDRVVGRVVLGSYMFARGPELDHWNAMICNEKEQVSRWHTLSS